MHHEEIFRLVRNQKTSPEILSGLVGYNVETDRLLSKHVNATPELLSQLAINDDYVVCRNVVANPSTPIEVLLRLGHKYPIQLFMNSKLNDVLVLDLKILERIERKKILKLLSRENVPASVLKWILTSGTKEQQVSYLLGFDRPDSINRKLLKSKHGEVVIALLERVDSIFIDWAKELGWVKNTSIEKEAFEMSLTDRMQINDWLEDKNRQIDGLWKILVPKEGVAATIQGELVRSIVRIQNEFYRNGMMNWGNGFYEDMVNFISRKLKSDETFVKFAKKIIDADILEIRKSGETGENIAAGRKPRSTAFGGSILFTSNVEESHKRLRALIAIWCEKHIEPIKNPDYVNPRDRIVQLRDPVEYLILSTPCPKCEGLVKETDLQFCCFGKEPIESSCGFAFDKSPDGRGLSLYEVEQLLNRKKLGPLEGFKTRRGRPFKGNLFLRLDGATKQYELKIKEYIEENIYASHADFSTLTSLGNCPKCGGSIFSFLEKYVCEKSVYGAANVDLTCDFKCSQSILTQPISPEQFKKLINTGATDVLEGFVSRFSKEPFKARIIWGEEVGEVGLDFIHEEK